MVGYRLPPTTAGYYPVLTGLVNPNGSVSGSIGQIYVDTVHQTIYVNVTGVNTGWMVV